MTQEILLMVRDVIIYELLWLLTDQLLVQMITSHVSDFVQSGRHNWPLVIVSLAKLPALGPVPVSSEQTCFCPWCRQKRRKRKEVSNKDVIFSPHFVVPPKREPARSWKSISTLRRWRRLVWAQSQQRLSVNILDMYWGEVGGVSLQVETVSAGNVTGLSSFTDGDQEKVQGRPQVYRLI